MARKQPKRALLYYPKTYAFDAIMYSIMSFQFFLRNDRVFWCTNTTHNAKTL